MAKVYLYKPGYNPYNFKDATGNQLAEFTDEYMMAKVVNAGHWYSTGYARIQNEIPIPCPELIEKCDGKIYIDYEIGGNVSASTHLSFNDNYMVLDTDIPRDIYVYDMPNVNTTIMITALHNSGSGAYVKVYSIYIEVPTLPSDKIKSSVKDAILNHKLIQHIALHESED